MHILSSVVMYCFDAAPPHAALFEGPIFCRHRLHFIIIFTGHCTLKLDVGS